MSRHAGVLARAEADMVHDLSQLHGAISSRWVSLGTRKKSRRPAVECMRRDELSSATCCLHAGART